MYKQAYPVLIERVWRSEKKGRVVFIILQYGSLAIVAKHPAKDIKKKKKNDGRNLKP